MAQMITGVHLIILSWYEVILRESFGNFNHSNSLLIDEYNLDHSFIIDFKQTETMSKLIAKWIKSSLE